MDGETEVQRGSQLAKVPSAQSAQAGALDSSPRVQGNKESNTLPTQTQTSKGSEQKCGWWGPKGYGEMTHVKHL